MGRIDSSMVTLSFHKIKNDESHPLLKSNHYEEAVITNNDLSIINLPHVYSIEHRNLVAKEYTENLPDNVKKQYIPKGFISSWAQYSILCNNENSLE